HDIRQHAALDAEIPGADAHGDAREQPFDDPDDQPQHACVLRRGSIIYTRRGSATIPYGVLASEGVATLANSAMRDVISALNAAIFAPESGASRCGLYLFGSTNCPCMVIEKCRCGPVARPVMPT